MVWFSNNQTGFYATMCALNGLILKQCNRLLRHNVCLTSVFAVLPPRYVNLSVVFHILTKLWWHYARDARQRKNSSSSIQFLSVSFLSWKWNGQKKVYWWMKKNSVASTTASLSRHCLAFFRVVKAGPHDHSFQSRNLRSKRCIPETLISFLCDCTACPITPRTSNLFMHTFQQNSAVNNNTLR